VRTRLLPLFPGDRKRTEVAVSACLADLSGGPGQAVRVDVGMLHRVLADMARRQENGAFSSTDWHRFLVSLVIGTDVDLPNADGEGQRRAPVALMGYLAGLPDLPGYIEVFGGRVVYDEWPQLAAEIAITPSPFDLLASSPLIMGLEARLARVRPVLDKVNAVVLVVEPFCATAMEEAYFRARVDKPLLVLESESLEKLDATKLSRLENFAKVAFRS